MIEYIDGEINSLDILIENNKDDIITLKTKTDNIEKTGNNSYTYNSDIVIKSNLSVEGTLIVSNLEVIGETTIIETDTYKTENLEISNKGNEPSLIIDHNNINNNIIEIKNNSQNKFILTKDGDISTSGYISTGGDISTSGDILFNGSINNISSNTLNNLKDIDYNLNDKIIEIDDNIKLLERAQILMKIN